MALPKYSLKSRKSTELWLDYLKSVAIDVGQAKYMVAELKFILKGQYAHDTLDDIDMFLDRIINNGDKYYKLMKGRRK